MARKVIIDCDPGIDDAVALCLALFDPRLDVVAITATAGNVDADQATRNVQAIVEQLDPPRLPRIGCATASARGSTSDSRHLFGEDGLGDSHFQVAELHQRHAADKIICDAVRDAPEDISIIALGPLTNIAMAFSRDPQLASIVGQLVIMGGAVTAPGNATPAAEFNMYCDPQSARAVLRSPTTKTLVPLDVTGQLMMRYDQLDELPDETSAAGRFLQKVLPFAFRSHRQQLGLEGVYLHDAVALLAATDPELFQTTAMAGDVETSGELTLGATVFDRRRLPAWRTNMEVTTEIDTTAVMDCILRGLRRAAAQE